MMDRKLRSRLGMLQHGFETAAQGYSERESFSLALTGDVMLGRLVNETIQQRGLSYPWGDMLPLLHSADLLCINLECALTSVTEQWAGDPLKPFFFRADPAVIETLRIARVRFAANANNHIGDFGVAGLLDTVARLDAAGIAHAGAGVNLEAAHAPVLLSAGTWRVAIVAFSDHPAEWQAGAHKPGLNYTPVSVDPRDFVAVERAIAEARASADFVILCIHWGPNMRLRPTPEFRAFAHRVIEAGADLLWGHSAHVPQGIELVDGKPILYDTGDFVDDYAVDPELRNDLSALFLLRVRPPLVERIELVPVVISGMQVNRARQTMREFIARRMEKLCAEMGTTLVDGPDGLVVDCLSARKA